MVTIDDAPDELAAAVREFFPEKEWNNAVAVAQLESGWNAFAVNDTRSWPVDAHGFIYYKNGVGVSREYSISWFQIDALNLPPGWKAEHLYNTRHNVGTAHLLFDRAGGWSPWLFSATALGI